MANSLTIAGLEQVGDVTNPEYHLGKHTNDGPGSGQNFGEILPDTDVISSLLLDGDIITGNRTGNRTWNLTTVVQGTDRADLSANVNTFVQAINADTYQVIWTPDGCESSVFTAYKATFSVAKDFNKNGQLVAEVVYSFDTAPFAKSLNPQMVTVAATGGPTSQQLDGMDSGSFTTGTLDTVIHYSGAGSGKMHTTTLVGTPSRSNSSVGRSISSVDLTSYGSLGIRIRAASNVTFNTGLGLNITDSHGAHIFLPVVTNRQLSPPFRLFSFDLTPARTAIDLTTVVAWSLAGSASPSIGSTQVNADDLRAFPPGSVDDSTAEGTLLTVPGILGSARTPISLAVSRASGTMADCLLHSPPSSQDSDLTILAGLSGGAITIPDANMNYDGTYSVVAIVGASDTPTRTITATFVQKLGATTIATQTVSRAVTGIMTMVALGELALPLVATPSENSDCSLVITLTSTGSDTFNDVALCDTRGQTVLVTGLTSVESVYVDAPDPTVGVGQVYASSTTDRTEAVSVLSKALLSGGPMLFEPGDNRLLAASSSGAPGVTVTYPPAWLDEAQV